MEVASREKSDGQDQSSGGNGKRSMPKKVQGREEQLTEDDYGAD